MNGVFRLADPSQLYPGTVTVQTPDGGEGRFPVRWRLLPSTEIDALLAQGSDVLAKRAVAGWDAVADHDGKPVPYSGETLDRLLEHGYVRRAIVDSFLRWSAGFLEKNSPPPPDAG